MPSHKVSRVVRACEDLQLASTLNWNIDAGGVVGFLFDTLNGRAGTSVLMRAWRLEIVKSIFEALRIQKGTSSVPHTRGEIVGLGSRLALGNCAAVAFAMLACGTCSVVQQIGRSIGATYPHRSRHVKIEAEGNELI